MNRDTLARELGDPTSDAYTRSRLILRYVRAHPGTNMDRVGETVGLSATAVRPYIQALRQRGEVAPPFHLRKISNRACAHPLRAAIVRYLEDTPRAVTCREISTALGIPITPLHTQIDKLRKLEIVSGPKGLVLV